MSINLPKYRPYYYPFGSSLNIRSFSAGSGFRFGFNGKEKQGEFSGDDYDFGARIYHGRSGRWFSVDPLEKKYPQLSPFSFCSNNPIFYIDPDGKEIYIHGSDATKAIAELQKKTSLQLLHDAETGKLTAMGSPSTDLDYELLKAIADKGIKVNLYTSKENSFKSRDGSTVPLLIGGYDGSVVKTEKIGDIDVEIIETTQYINMEHSEKTEKADVSNQGSDVFHEAIESYYGGLNDPGGIYNQDKWKEAHDKALKVDPTALELNFNLNTKTKQAGLIEPFSGNFVDLRPMTLDEKKKAGIND